MNWLNFKSGKEYFILVDKKENKIWKRGQEWNHQKYFFEKNDKWNLINKKYPFMGITIKKNCWKTRLGAEKCALKNKLKKYKIVQMKELNIFDSYYKDQYRIFKIKNKLKKL